MLSIWNTRFLPVESMVFSLRWRLPDQVIMHPSIEGWAGRIRRADRVSEGLRRDYASGFLRQWMVYMVLIVVCEARMRVRKSKQFS